MCHKIEAGAIVWLIYPDFGVQPNVIKTGKTGREEPKDCVQERMV